MKVFVLLSLIYAAYGMPLRYLEAEVPLALQLAWMLTLGSVLGMGVYWRVLRQSLSSGYTRKDWVLIVLKALTFYPLGTMLWGYGLFNASYANVAFVNALPLSTVVGALVLRERLSFRRIAAVGVGFVGVLVMAWQGSMTSWGVGEMAVAASMIFYGLSYATRRGMSKRVSDLGAALWQMIFGALMCWLIVGVSGLSMGFSAGNFMYGWLILGLMGVINLVMIWLQNVGFGKKDVVVGGTLLNLETLFGLIISIWLYAEIPVMREWAGGLLILLSTFMIGR
jgi:drug/metabolite transporter (DMT)-like permease